MRFTYTVGTTEPNAVEFERNWFSGRLRVTVDGREILENSIINPGTHFWLTLEKEYTFEVGTTEKKKIRIVQRRPLWFAGFRPHTYSFYCDEVMMGQHKGF